MPRQSWTSSTVQVLVLRLVLAIGLVGVTGLVRTILVFGQMREAGRTFLPQSGRSCSQLVITRPWDCQYRRH